MPRNTVIQGWLFDIENAENQSPNDQKVGTTSTVVDSDTIRIRKRKRTLHPSKTEWLAVETRSVASSRKMPKTRYTEKDIPTPNMQMRTRVQRGKQWGPENPGGHTVDAAGDPAGSVESSLASPGDDNDEDIFVDERTPRPKSQSATIRSSKSYVASLQSRDHDALHNRPRLESTSSATSSSAASTGRNSKRPRSTSPVKSVSSLQFASQPFKMHSLDGLDEDIEFRLGKDGFDLFEMLFRVQTGRQTIPRAVEASLRQLLGRVRTTMLEHCFHDEGKAERHPVEFEKVLWITKRSNRCKIEQDAEPEWNCGVHYPTLELAVEECDLVDQRNITAARIIPAYLPSLQKKRVEGKMVDFAFHLNPTPALSDLIRRFIDNESHSLPGLPPTINHTDYGPLALKPIAVSIESKVSGEGETKALVQLAIWVHAHIQRLRIILEHRGKDPAKAEWKIPALPLVLVSGAQWHVYFAVAEDDGQVSIFGSVLAGDTNMVHGTYQVLAALRILVSWSRNTYSNWLERALM